MEVICVIETFDRKLRCTDRRQRKGVLALLPSSSSSSSSGVRLSLKSISNNDLWISKAAKLFYPVGSDAAKLSLHIPEYDQILIITGPAAEQLKKLAADINTGLSTASELAKAAATAAAEAKLKPKPKVSPLKPVPTNPPRPKSSPEKYEFSTISTGSGFTPNQKKKRQGPTPTKENDAPPPRATSSPGFRSTTINQYFRSPPKPQQQQQQQQQQPVIKIKPTEMTETQRSVISAAGKGDNVFLTGGAGTGKSAILSLIVDKLQAVHSADDVFVTATTGLAAVAIGGTTIQHFAGLQGTFNEGDDKGRAVDAVMTRPHAVRRWQKCKALIIDEVSMLSCDLLELLDLIGQRTRACPRAFGGLQVILSGDFFQLPPVTRGGSSSNAALSTLPSTARVFCFQSPVWGRLSLRSFVLERIFRQQHDATFADLLNSVRWGRLDSEGLRELNQAVGRRIGAKFGVLPTQIMTHKADVDRLNAKELDGLAGEAKLYCSSDTGDETMMKFLDTHCQARKVISLKVGAQVILVKTIDAPAGLVNGARGVIVKFNFNETKPCVRFSDGTERTLSHEKFEVQLGGRVVASRFQLPLELAWGISVHKSQGMSLECAVLHLKSVFEYGQAYVALSRVKTAEGLSLSSPLEMRHIRAHPDVVAFYSRIGSAAVGK